jgi:DNA invertase Pin-like site-specific DNA recombinase
MLPVGPAWLTVMCDAGSRTARWAGGGRPGLLDGGRWSLVQAFVKVESGKRNNRPKLAAALAACKKHKAKLIIAKLDRLSRNLAFIATLMDSGVEFIAVDNPHANKLTVHILAAVAQHEREVISARTSAALKAAKARGKRLGNPKLSEARRHAARAKKEKADRYSANVLPVIREIQKNGVKSLRGISCALAARGIPTARGGSWTPVQVDAPVTPKLESMSAFGGAADIDRQPALITFDATDPHRT